MQPTRDTGRGPSFARLLGIAAALIAVLTTLLSVLVVGGGSPAGDISWQGLSSGDDWRDPFWLAAGVFAGVSGTLAAMAGLYQLYRIRARPSAPSTMDPERARADFAAAVAMLSDGSAVTRSAGVGFLADLADNWEGSTQQCVEALCGYLRLTPLASPSPAEAEVRRKILRTIRDHLLPHSSPSWDGLAFDLTGAVLPGADFSGVVLTAGSLTFRNAVFPSGEIDFAGAVLAGATVDFSQASFHDTAVTVVDAKVTGGSIVFQNASFHRGVLLWAKSTFDGGTISFRDTTFDGVDARFIACEFGDTEVSFAHAAITGGRLDLPAAEFRRNAPDFSFLKVTGGQLSLDGLRLDRRAGLTFEGAVVHGGLIDFGEAELRAGRIRFSHARLAGGTVDFSRTRFSGGGVDFDGADFAGGVVTFEDSPSAHRPGAVASLDLRRPPRGVIAPGPGRDPGGEE